MSPFISDDRRNSVTETFEQDTSPQCSAPPVDSQSSKKADLIGPGIGDYAELEQILPGNYHPLLTPKETETAISHLKRYIEDNLCKELNLLMVEVPLIVGSESGVSDMLDGDGSHTPSSFTSRISINEAYRDYEPAVDAATIVRQLLTSVPDQHLRGLDCIVLTNLSGQPRKHRLGKTTSRGGRVALPSTRGLYHPRWKGHPPWIELYLDQFFRSHPRWALRIPLIRNLAVADVLYHELGHHVHLFICPEYREKEDVADEWKKRFTTILIRRRYWYLIPLIHTLKMFRRT